MTTEHILYIVGSLSVIGLTLYLMHFVKNQKWKNFFLLVVSLACFFIHISTMYTTFFENGGGHHGNAYDNQLFPIYFCNWVMYLLLAVSVWQDRSTKLFKNIATFVAWGGIFGGLITLFVNEPHVEVWYEFQSALSHSCLLLGSLYLFTGGYVKLNVYNVIPYTFGILTSGVAGGLTELAYYLNGLPFRNCMYFKQGPAEAPFMKGWVFAIVMLLIIFVIGMVYEYFTKKKEDRWYKSIKDIKEYLPIK